MDGWCPSELMEWAYGETGMVFTYIIQCESTGFLKIGKSRTPKARMKNMQTGCPSKLQMVWSWPEDIERELHSHFESRKVRGEWFDVDIDEAIAIASFLSKQAYREWCESIRERSRKDTVSRIQEYAKRKIRKLSMKEVDMTISEIGDRLLHIKNDANFYRMSRLVESIDRIDRIAFRRSPVLMDGLPFNIKRYRHCSDSGFTTVETLANEDFKVMEWQDFRSDIKRMCSVIAVDDAIVLFSSDLNTPYPKCIVSIEGTSDLVLIRTSTPLLSAMTDDRLVPISFSSLVKMYGPESQGRND
jgi:hypothetical protein